ncbi:MAG: hypothetical protein C4304_09965 [candidate division GAL15 bacterium]
MAEVASRLPGSSAVGREGFAQSELLCAAQELQADLIIVGTHGRTKLERVLVSSMAEHVVRYSPVPVLTVRRAHH